MCVALCETEEEISSLYPVARLCSVGIWLCIHVCVYFGEITMGGCVFSLHGKIILLTVWKINDLSLSLQALKSPEMVHMVALRLNIKPL